MGYELSIHSRRVQTGKCRMPIGVCSEFRDHDCGKFCYYNTMPINESKRKEGRWARNSDGLLYCTACGTVPTNRIQVHNVIVYDIQDIYEFMKYCPLCGAKMNE